MKEFVKRIARAFGFWFFARPPYLRRASKYKPPSKPKRALTPRHFEPITLVAGEIGGAATATDIYQRWKNEPGGHKFLHYFPVYQRIVDAFRDRPITMLEIGVWNGASARMWHEVLHTDSIFVGIDIDPDCARFDAPSERIFIRTGDQSDQEFLTDLTQEFGPFDLIIDDGSHIVSHMIASFDALFLNALKPGGVYVVEDTHSNFWQYWRDRRHSFVDIAKDLVDVMHEHYRHDNLGYFQIEHPYRLKSASISRLGAAIEEISFVDSMVIIRKSGQDRALPICIHIPMPNQNVNDNE